MKASADYTYTFIRGFLCIVDEDRGNMSVTNCIEDVVRDICEIEEIDFAAFPVIYRDSDGKWDGWDYDEGHFILLQTDTPEDAIELMLSYTI